MAKHHTITAALIVSGLMLAATAAHAQSYNYGAQPDGYSITIAPNGQAYPTYGGIPSAGYPSSAPMPPSTQFVPAYDPNPPPNVMGGPSYSPFQPPNVMR